MPRNFYKIFRTMLTISNLLRIILALGAFYLPIASANTAVNNEALSANTANTPALADESYLRELEELAEEYVRGHIELLEDEKLEIEVRKLDNGRLVPICEGNLNLTVASGKIRKNNTIKAQCISATTPFTLYIVVKAIVKRPFVTVVNQTPKDTILEKSNLTLDYLDKYLDRGNNFTDINQLIGIKTKRNLRPGQPIQKNQVCVVCNGSLVTIEAANEQISVKTDGEALQDGTFHDKIRVRNLKTGKVVRAIVINPNLVRITLD